MTQTRNAALTDRSPSASDDEQDELERGLERAADDGWPSRGLRGRAEHVDATGHRAADTWEYLISARPRFAAPTQSARSSAAIQALNELGESGWEAVGMTVLVHGNVAVLLKRPVDGNR